MSIGFSSVLAERKLLWLELQVSNESSSSFVTKGKPFKCCSFVTYNRFIDSNIATWLMVAWLLVCLID